VEPDTTDAAPGTILGISGSAMSVAAGHGERIAIERVQPEGRRAMEAREFLAGHPLQPGARFTSP